MTRPSWDAYFMSIAHTVATRSPCVKRQVGAVLVSEDKAILATGYNGPPRGAPHRDDKTCVRIGIPSGTQADVVCCAHAESNAIAQAARHGVPVKGATLYVTTSPCAWCARSIVNAGVVRVVREGDYADPHAAGVFAESNVPVDLVQSADLLVTLHHDPALIGVPLKIRNVTVERAPVPPNNDIRQLAASMGLPVGAGLAMICAEVLRLQTEAENNRKRAELSDAAHRAASEGGMRLHEKWLQATQRANMTSPDQCPQCGGALERDEADIGIGIQYGPAGCPACHWTEGSPYDPDFMQKLAAPEAPPDGEKSQS